jgi:sulfate adenylyltransferase
LNSTETSILISPYGEQLIDLLVSSEEIEDLKAYANALPSTTLSDRSVCDLELMATGAFSPLDRFMGQSDYERVRAEMRLADGRLFPIPVTLPVKPFPELRIDADIALRNSRNELLAVLSVEEIFEWDLAGEAQDVLGTQDLRHPFVAEMHRWGKLNVSGRLQVVQLPQRYDFRELRLTPLQTRERLERLGRTQVVAFQTRNPLHRVHEELTKRAIQEVAATLLLHPVVGMTKPGDVDYYTRVRTYKALAAKHYQRDQILLALLPLAMRLAGPREALWHAIIRRNYGANHLIVGRNHANPGVGSDGQPFYGNDEAQKLVDQYGPEVGVSAVPFGELVFLPEDEIFEETSKVSPDQRSIQISGTQVRDEYLNNGVELPTWFTRPEVAEILSETYPPRYRQGVCIWFTGLSGSGKSTTAEVLTVLLLEHGRQVTFLDGDVVRTHLSKGLGFSKEDRDTNVRRIGFVASQIVRHGGIVICAVVSPYRATRNEVRGMVGHEHFIEVFVNTPLEVCEDRDAKGLYAEARQGKITGFTGIDDPYEPPEQAQIVLDTVKYSVEENATVIMNFLTQQGFIPGNDWAQPNSDDGRRDDGRQDHD